MIDSELAAFLQGGRSLVVGTVDADGTPLASRAWGVEIRAPDRLRVLLPGEDEATRANLEATQRIALTATHIATLRSVQVKGRHLRTEPPTERDLGRSEAYRAAFYDEIHEVDGTAIDLLLRLTPIGLVAVDIEVLELYDQTPGPSAGGRLQRAGS